MLLTDRMPARRPSVRLRNSWLSLLLLGFLRTCLAVLSPADKGQLEALLKSSQPGFQKLQSEPCSVQGLSELQEAGVILTCTPVGDDTEEQQCQRITLDGDRHTGKLIGLSVIRFPELAEFEVHNTLLTESLPANLDTPKLQVLSFKNNTELRSSLPSEWGVSASKNASFPQLELLNLEHGMWQGLLPAAWGGNISFPKLTTMIITGPVEAIPNSRGLRGGIPSEWMTPGSFPRLRSIDLSYNSLSGWVPSSLMGISEPGEVDIPELFPDLSSVRIFQQWGSQMCAHISSSSSIPAVPRILDLGDDAAPSSRDILKYMKSQPPPVFSANADTCEAANAGQKLLRAAAKQLAAKAEWLLAGPDILLTSTPYVLFPSDKDGEAPQEAFIGLCDLPEMLSLADGLHFVANSQRAACEATLNYCEWGGVTCASMSANVQSIAVGSEAALQQPLEGINDTAQPLAKGDDGSLAYLPTFSRSGVLPRLESLFLGTEVWGSLPGTWTSQAQLESLKTVSLLGDNFIHALPRGWATHGKSGMKLTNLTIATVSTIGCVPTYGSDKSVTSLQLVPAPSFDQFPSSQMAVRCPIPPTMKGRSGSFNSGSANTYKAIKEMNELKIDGTSAVLDLASLGCSTTNGNECPVQQPAGDCTVQLQSLDVAEGNICGEGYLPTALGCPFCSSDAAGGCQGSCEQPGQDGLCRWSSDACADKMVQLIAGKASLHQSIYTLVVPDAAREIPSGAYVLALSAALAAGAEDLGSRLVGRPHVQGLVVASDRSECSPDAKMIVASLDGLEQELPNSERFSDALSRPSLLFAPVICGGGEMQQLQASQLAFLSPPDVPATHVVVEVDSVSCRDGNCAAAGRKLLEPDAGHALLEPILQHQTTQQVFIQSLEELSGSKNLGYSVSRQSAADLLPQDFIMDAEDPAENRKVSRLMVAGIAGGVIALVAALCCGCVCMQRRKARTPQPSVDQYVGLSESRALPLTSTGASPTGTPLQGTAVRPEAVQKKMSWLKQLAGRKRQQGSSQTRAVWTKFDHLLSVMTCANRLPADVSPEDAQVQNRRTTPGEMVAVGMRQSFVEKPQLPVGKTINIGGDHEKLSPTVPNADAIAKDIAANKEALASLVLRGPDAKKHAALRVASAYDSLFSDDPFGIYRTSPFQTPLWEMLLSHRGEGPFKEHMLPARRFHCVGKGGFESGVAELQELQKNRLAVIHEFRSVMSSDPMIGLKLQRASTSGVPLSASSLHPGTPLVHVDEERAFDGQDQSDNSQGEEESVRAGSMNMSMNMSTQLSAAPSGISYAATAPPGRIPSASLGSGGLPAHRASTTPPSKLPRHIMIGESGPLSEDKVNQREKQYLDIIGQSSFPGQLPRPGSATLPSGSTPDLPLLPTSISHTDEPVHVTHESTDAPGLPELPRIGADTAGRASTPSACISRSFSWPYCQSLASMDFQALARDEDGFLRTSTKKDDGKSLDHGLFLGTDPRHPTVLLGSVYFVGDRQKARLNKGAENANAPYKPPDRVMGAPQPSTELPAAVTAAVAAAQSRRMARTGKVHAATDRIPADTTADINRIAVQAAQELCRGGHGDSHSSLTTPTRSATMHYGAVSGHMDTDDQVTTHTGLLAKLSNDFANRDQKAGHQVYIPPDGLEDSTTGLQTPAHSSRVQPQDDAALIQQALQMCDTDKIRDSIGATAGVAWGAAPARDTTGAAPPGPGGYMKLEDLMNGTVPSESGAPYPVSGGPQAAIEPPDKVSVRYDQHSEAGIDTAFNVLLECFGMLQWQGPAKDIAVSMLEDLKSHVSAQHENRSIFDERLDLADLDMTSFRADEELGTDIVEPPAAQAEDRNKNAHLGLGLGKLTPLAEDKESDEGEGNNTQASGAVVPLPPRMPGPPDKDMCIEPSKLTYISLLGRGAFGEVHYGTWEAPDGQVHDVAIKVLLATRYGNLEECEKDRQKFVREMQLMMRMTHHSIVRCFGGAMARHEGEADFMVLEYIPGGTLDHYVHEHRRNSRLTLGEVLVIATDLADVLRYLHKLGVVHQDLKPSNILLNEHGEVKLTDFGISKIKRSTCLSQCMVGTPSYTAPEVWVGDQVNEKCDIFALGILLWECMTGTRPFKNMHAFQIMMHLQTNQKRGEDWLPFPKQTPPEFKRLVRRCWHAENRFRISADEALASAVLLRSTISEATQSVPVELDVGLLPDNHTQGVLIPSNGIKGKKPPKKGRRASPHSSPQVSGGVNAGRQVPSHDPGMSRSRNGTRPVRTERSRAYGGGDSNVYVPSSPTKSRDTSGTRLQISSGQGHSSSETDSVFRTLPNPSPQPGMNPADIGGHSTGKASWAEAWSIEDPNSRAITPMWNIGFGGDTTSNLLPGSNSGMSGGHRSGLSNARLMQQGPASSSAAQARPSGGPSRMPAVLESGQQESAGSRDLDAQPSSASANGNDAAHRRPSSSEMEPHAKRPASNVNVQLANLPPMDSGAPAPKTAAASPSSTPSKAQAAERRSLLGPSRAKTPEERCVPPPEEVHLPMPVPSAQHSTMVATESAALPSRPASGQLSHTRPLPQPCVGMGASMAKTGRQAMPWNPTTTNTVTDVTLQPSIMIDETSRQPLATVPGPSLADAWKRAQAGGQAVAP